MTSLAIILVDLERGRFGHRAALLEELGGKTVLQHTIDRAARIKGVDAIVLLHQVGQTLDGRLDVPEGAPPISAQAVQTRPGDAWLRDVIDAGRKWSLTAWRGGIGGMTVYDELLPAYPIHCAMREHHAESAVVLRADWCLFDPALASEQLELHRSAPDAMKVTFTQAPPGLSPLVIHHSVAAEMVEHSATVANLLCYNPKKPTIDPVGKDVNVPIPASVRDQYRRLIYDTPRAIDHLRAVADVLGDDLGLADAVAVTDASRAVEIDQPWRQFERLPQQFNIELTPRRQVNGPIVPQHHLELPREAMTAETVDALLGELSGGRGGACDPPERISVGSTTTACSGGSPSLHPGHPTTLHSDTALLFGGLGDALEHGNWYDILERATRSDLLGVGIETDLLVEPEAIDQLASLPLDVISVRLNADSAATYEKLMGTDGFARVMDNLKHLFQCRNTNRQQGKGFRGWVVPRLVKVADNLKDLETFFERWMTVSGWAVVDRALTGRGLIPDIGPVPMEVPRPPGRPIDRGRQMQRLTVLSDGRVCLCGQDWLGRLPLGRVGERPLIEQWQGAAALADEADSFAVVCPACSEWLEAQQQLTASTAG